MIIIHKLPYPMIPVFAEVIDCVYKNVQRWAPLVLTILRYKKVTEMETQKGPYGYGYLLSKVNE